MKAIYENLNHLFIKDEDGYYRYDSNLNYARYNGVDGFDVYASTFNEEGTTNKEAVGFFPFNDYNSYYNCIHGGTQYDYNNNFKGYSPHNNNYSDKIGYYNHHFGMTVEASFVMTPDGKYLGKDIEFNFSGDDDLWVFVDGVLVLDIGGVHNPVTGKINFNSGEVIVRDGVHNTDPNQLVVNDSKPGPNTIQEAFSRVTGKEWDDSPYTRHTLKVFYLERGGMYSNLAIDFNLPVYKTVTVEKELEGLTEAQLERYDNEYFYYQVKINGQPYTGPYGVLTRPATDEEKANWVSEYSEETGEYIGGHWTDPDHPNTETINKFGELVKWHIAVENGIVRVKPGWYFTIEELGQNDTFSVAELYGYDSSYRFYDGQEDNTQTSDLMEPFFAPTAIYTYKDVEDQKHEEELPVTEVTVTSDENDSSNPRHVVSVGGIEADPEIAYPEPTTHTENENAPSFTYYYPGTTFTIPNVDSAKEVTLWLYAGHDQWWYLYDNDDPTNYLNKNENNHPTPDYHVWTCQLYCDKKVIWDLEEVYDHIVTNHDAYSLEGENAPVTTYPKYEMRLFKEEDSEEYSTHIEPLLNAPGNGHADSEQLWKGSITDLPLYEFANSEDGGTYIYTYEIVEKTIGSDGVVVAPVHGTETTGGEPNPVLYNGETSQYLVKWEEQSDGTMKFTNKKKETTKVSATKAWVDPDGEPMVPPHNATVTFTLFADGETTGKTVVLDGTTVQSQIAAQLAEQIEAINASEMTPEEKAEAIAVAEAEAEAALVAWTYGELTTAWKAEWKDLPKYKYVVKDETPEDPSGEPLGDTPDDTEAEPIKEPVEIVYTVKETVTYPGYVEVDPGENYVEVDPDTFSVTNGGTITNKQLKYSLKIVKVDANNTETGLSGAKFQLTRKLPGESGFTKFEHDSFEVDSTNANKRTGPFTVSSTEGIILEGLIPGEYQIEEKTAPNGYIITLEPFTVTLNGDGTVTPSDTSGVLVVPLPKDNNNPAGLQIGNEPGAALPSTGGHGTRLFTILGSILIAGASLLLLRRRRTI